MKHPDPGRDCRVLEQQIEAGLTELVSAQVTRRLSMMDHDDTMQERTRPTLPLTFVPCPLCGEVERLRPEGVYRIDHDYSKHPGFEKMRR